MFFLFSLAFAVKARYDGTYGTSQAGKKKKRETTSTGEGQPEKRFLHVFCRARVMDGSVFRKEAIVTAPSKRP